MKPDWQDDGTPEGYERNKAHWREKWAMFAPREGVHREAWFHVDLPTFILAIVVGAPLGTFVATSLTGQPALGGVVGVFFVMMVFGFFRRRLQIRSERGSEVVVRPAVARSRLRTVVKYTAITGIVAAGAGVWFALSEGDIDPVIAGVRFGALGAAPGLVVGLIAAAARRR